MEFVWVVRRSDLFPDNVPQGFIAVDDARFDPACLQRAVELGFFVERREAEQEAAWKQVIPYCIVACPGGILTFERLPKGTENRLHGLFSIGVGGHVEPVDSPPACSGSPDCPPVTGTATLANGLELFARGAKRELCEELVIEEHELGQRHDLEILGIVNDDSNSVGSVHIGLVLGARLARNPEIRESDRMRAQPTPLVELRSLCDASRPFESWSGEILRAQGWETRF